MAEEKSATIKKSNRKIISFFVCAICLLALVGGYMDRGGNIKSLQQENMSLLGDKNRLDAILSYGANKIKSIEHVFEKIHQAGDMWMYFSEHPRKVAEALNNTAKKTDDFYNLEGIGKELMYSLREAFVGQGGSLLVCPPEICPGEDANLSAMYENLDGKYMTPLGNRMETDTLLIITTPQIIHGMILLKGDPVFDSMDDVEKSRVLKLVLSVKEQYFSVAESEIFQSWMRNFLELRNEQLIPDESLGDEEKERMIEEYHEKVRQKRQGLLDRFDMLFEDQELIYNTFSEEVEEWRQIFDLLERKLKV